MSDARWYEVERHAQAVQRHFAMAVRLHDEEASCAAGLDAYRAEMALMHAMQSGHTSLEMALTRILLMFGEELPVGTDWRRDLLVRASASIGSRPAILDDALLRAADNTRRFRHRAMHNYEGFDAGLAKPSIEAASILADRFAPAIVAFRLLVDP